MASTLPIRKINSYAQLLQNIAELELVKDEQEIIVKENLKSIYQSLQPIELLKTTLKKIKNDTELGTEASDVSLKLGADFLIGKLFKKNDSLGGYVKAIAAEQIISFLLKKYDKEIHLFLGNAKEKLFSLFNSVIHKHDSEKTKQE